MQIEVLYGEDNNIISNTLIMGDITISIPNIKLGELDTVIIGKKMYELSYIKSEGYIYLYKLDEIEWNEPPLDITDCIVDYFKLDK